MDGLGETLRLFEVGGRGFHPQQICIFGEGEATHDAALERVLWVEPEEAFLGTLACQERAVALVDVGGDELRAFGIGAGDDHGRDTGRVGGEAGRVQVGDVLLYRDQDLAAHMAAFLLRGELIFEMDACRAGLDVVAGQLERVQRAAKAGLGIGDDRGEPVDVTLALKLLDLVAALQRAVDPARQFGTGVGRIERLVGIHATGRVGIGSDLPAGQVDRLQPGAHHLHGLVAGHGAEGMNVILGMKQVPQLVGAVAGQ